MKRSTRGIVGSWAWNRSRRLCNAMLSLAVTGLLSPAVLQANPDGAKVIHGNVNIAHPSPGVMEITNSPGAIIHWRDFSISADELTRFLQQKNTSAVLNRVTGQNPSQILGQLMSNGRVFLINRNGVVFGHDARVDTAGLVASTLNMSDEDFLAERYRFDGGEQAGDIVNRGVIQAGKNGDVLIVAPNVENHGLIHSDGGQLILAAGRKVSLTSLNLDNVAFEIQAPGNQALNLGELLSDGGAIGVFAGSIDHGGRAQADTVVSGSDGEIRLVAGRGLRTRPGSVARSREGRVRMQSEGETSVSGTVDVSGVRGGTAQILGEHVTLETGSVDASGQARGGSVNIGGNYQGKGPLPNATMTTVGENVTVTADATRNGDGGRIIVWSDDTTTVDGALSARGGPRGGDGGFIETSGKIRLEFSQPASVAAPNGRAGTWLLDPEDITIDSGKAESIESALNEGSNVSIETSDSGDDKGNITVASSITKTEGDDAALSMKAHNKIDVDADISSDSGKLAVSLRAGKSVNINASIRTNGGSLSTAVTGTVTEQKGAGDEPDNSPNTNDSGKDETDRNEADNDGLEVVDSESNAVPDPVEDPAESGAGKEEGSTNDGEQDSGGDDTGDSGTDEADREQMDTDPDKLQAADAMLAADMEGFDGSDMDLRDNVEAAEPDDDGAAPIESNTLETEPMGNDANATLASVDSSDADGGHVDVNGEVQSKGGDIHLDSGADGTTWVGGVLDASDNDPGAEGGSIRILGDNVGLSDDAEVDASGDSGGGEILVGGDRQGKNPDVRNATATYIGEGASVKADATDSGDGGKVIVYADETARVHGELSARGGPKGGDGGFVETSGKVGLSVSRAPDTSAPNGSAGTWLIDPANIDVVPGNGASNIGTTSPFQPSGNNALLGVDLLNNALSGGANVQISTAGAGTQEGNITFTSGTELNYTGTNTLDFLAANDINIHGRIQPTIGAGLNLNLVSDTDGDGAGRVNIDALGSAAVLDSGAGDINITGNGLFLDGDESFAIVSSRGGSLIIDVDGPVHVSSGGRIGNVGYAPTGVQSIRADWITLSATDGAQASIIYSGTDAQLIETNAADASGNGITANAVGSGSGAIIAAYNETAIQSIEVNNAGISLLGEDNGGTEISTWGSQLVSTDASLTIGGPDSSGGASIVSGTLGGTASSISVGGDALIQAGTATEIFRGNSLIESGVPLILDIEGKLDIIGGHSDDELGNRAIINSGDEDLSVSAEEILIQAGSGDEANSAGINTNNGAADITTKKLTILGGSGGKKSADADGDRNDYSGNEGFIYSGGDLSLTITDGDLRMEGGPGYSSGAFINGGGVDIQVANSSKTAEVLLKGGGREWAIASIASIGTEDVNLVVGDVASNGRLKIEGGTSVLSFAGISSTQLARVVVGRNGNDGEISLQGAGVGSAGAYISGGTVEVIAGSGGGGGAIQLQGGGGAFSPSSIFSASDLTLIAGDNGPGLVELLGGSGYGSNARLDATKSIVSAGADGFPGEIRLEAGSGQFADAIMSADNVDLAYGTCTGCFLPPVFDGNATIGIDATELVTTIYDATIPPVVQPSEPVPSQTAEPTIDVNTSNETFSLSEPSSSSEGSEGSQFFDDRGLNQINVTTVLEWDNSNSTPSYQEGSDPVMAFLESTVEEGFDLARDLLESTAWWDENRPEKINVDRFLDLLAFYLESGQAAELPSDLALSVVSDALEKYTLERVEEQYGLWSSEYVGVVSVFDVVTLVRASSGDFGAKLSVPVRTFRRLGLVYQELRRLNESQTLNKRLEAQDAYIRETLNRKDDLSPEQLQKRFEIIASYPEQIQEINQARTSPILTYIDNLANLLKMRGDVLKNTLIELARYPTSN